LKSPEYNADPYIPKDENGSNSDDVHLELNKKAGPFSKRVKRPTVAQSPHLERIQEDEGLKRNAFREESIEEVRFSEAVGENKLDDQENGYSSLSEPQTPKDLSYEDLPSVIEYDQNFDSDQTVVRSKSDPMPAGLSEGETVLIDATINKHKKNNSCKSEHSITNNIKEPDRGSTTSLESTGKIRAASATSNDDSGLETPSTTPVLPVTPTEDVSPSPVKKTPKTVTILIFLLSFIKFKITLLGKNDIFSATCISDNMTTAPVKIPLVGDTDFFPKNGLNWALFLGIVKYISSKKFSQNLISRMGVTLCFFMATKNSFLLSSF